MAILAVALPLGLAPTSALAAPPSYYPSGPQVDTPRSSVVAGGWEVCYQDFYDDSGTPLTELLAACDGDYLMLAGGRTSPDTGTYTVLAAAPRADVLWEAGTAMDAARVANGTGWYFSDSYSWGFVAEGSVPQRGSCDTGAERGELRLCWHTGGGAMNGGYRAGLTTAWDTNWSRTVLQPQAIAASWPADPTAFPEQPTSTVSAKRTVQVTLEERTGATRPVGMPQLTGVNADDFDVLDNTCPAQLTANEIVTCSVKLRFVPQTAGAHAAQLGFSRNQTTHSVTGIGGPLPTGPKGDAGDQGATGATGDTGAQGPIGPVGPVGAVGPAGAVGAVGPQGPVGPAGAVGPAGEQGQPGMDGTDSAVKGKAKKAGRATCKVRPYRAGSRISCVFSRKVTAKTLVNVRDARGSAAAARGRGTNRMIFVSRRPIQGKLIVEQLSSKATPYAVSRR